MPTTERTKELTRQFTKDGMERTIKTAVKIVSEYAVRFNPVSSTDDFFTASASAPLLIAGIDPMLVMASAIQEKCSILMKASYQMGLEEGRRIAKGLADAASSFTDQDGRMPEDTGEFRALKKALNEYTESTKL